MHVLRMREIQIGLIIAIVTYLSLLFSSLDSGMHYSHRFIVILNFGLLVCELLNLLILVKIPHQGLLVLISKRDTWFLSFYKMIFFFIFFTLTAIIVSLLASAFALHFDRSQDIFSISMFVASIYYLIIAFWGTYNFITRSLVKENMEYKNDRI